VREGLGEWLVGEVKVARGAWRHPKMFIVSDFLPSWQIRESFFLTFRLFFSLCKKTKNSFTTNFYPTFARRNRKNKHFGGMARGTAARMRQTYIKRTNNALRIKREMNMQLVFLLGTTLKACRKILIVYKFSLYSNLITK